MPSPAIVNGRHSCSAATVNASTVAISHTAAITRMTGRGSSRASGSGGGWGDPLDRDPALVALEIAQGLVTAQGALRYGVVIADGTVDDAATQALRAKMRTERGEVPVFNFGPDLETLRANCLAETGLPAPKPPRWANA